MDKRTVVRLTFTNPVSALYLTAVGGAIAVALLTPVVNGTGDPGFIWVWPLFFTMPTSLLVISTTWLWEAAPTWVAVAGVAAAGLVQSFALGWLTESLRGRSARRRPHAG